MEAVVWERAPYHRAKCLGELPTARVFLPSYYSPELNPAEQVFRVLRPKLANRIFTTIAELEAAIAEHLQPYWEQPALVRRLTGYSWWTAAAGTTSQCP